MFLTYMMMVIGIFLMILGALGLRFGQNHISNSISGICGMIVFFVGVSM